MAAHLVEKHSPDDAGANVDFVDLGSSTEAELDTTVSTSDTEVGWC